MPTTDEWVSVDEMANRHWRPDRLGYKRARSGMEDNRMKYMLYFLDVRGQRVLELGPRHGHHTVMLDKLGALEIVGVEGRMENVRTCELVRNRYKLAARFVLQDIEKLAAGEHPQFEPGFDLVFSAGVLYHLADPGAALAWMRTMAPRLFLGTHYVEQAAMRHYRPPVFTMVTYRERPAVGFAEQGLEDSRGGLYPRSTWLHEDQLLDLLREVGYDRVEVLGKDVQAGHPHITILAEAQSRR